MKWSRITKTSLVVAIVAILATAMLAPSFSISSSKTAKLENSKEPINYNDQIDRDNLSNVPYQLDRDYVTEEDRGCYISSNNDDQNDAGYNTDTGDTILRSLPVYPGEIADGAPGRGRTGNLDSSDSDDWYMFSVCEGQSIEPSLSSSENYDFELANTEGDPVGKSYTADATGNYFIHIYAAEGAEAGEYSFDIDLVGQNDAGTDSDAGNSIGEATPIGSGSYSGYMDMNDQEDWYSFDVSSGQGITVNLEAPLKADVDVALYNPSDEMVHREMYYGDDELEYPANVAGQWKIQLTLFPGWDESKWPDDYYLYGSGAYEFELSIGGSVEAPPGPIPQPDITPIAQTFKIINDPDSNKDEYGYLASIPACNYIDDGERYVSPIVYEDDDTPTHWFGTVDDTTQYLIDDWNTYLDRHGMEAEVYHVPLDPIAAAADIATENWESSDTAVVVVDGSDFEDEVETVVDKTTTLNAQTDITTVTPDALQEIAGNYMNPMFIGSKWGAIAVHGLGSGYSGEAGLLSPRYEVVQEDWWPSPYDINGPDTDPYYPISIPGIWSPLTTSLSGLDELEIIKVAGDRYKIRVTNTDCSLKVTVTTDEPSYLRVYLIDPKGNVRRPSVPHWNGGKINPIHIWNGGHWEGIGFDDWRAWEPTLSTEHSEEVHYPMTGKWTAIVVPATVEAAGGSFSYHVTAEIRQHSAKRTAAALSAANGAVIASLEHAPLLYVTETDVPAETSDALSQLGATNIIFVNINEVSSASPPGSVTEYTTLQAVIDNIKEHSENFITITSLATGDGYFAPAAMIAAYHGSPVINIGEAPDAYNTLDMAAAWREYGGDYYHGCRALGHLPHMSEPFDLVEFIKGLLEGKFPSPGFDLKLRWFSAIHDGIHELIDGYGLDLDGKEAYLFVSPRDTDIRDLVCRAMTGNNSYAGHIPVETTAFSSALICRDILYPAIIYANPGRDVTTSQLMNFPDGGTWTTNDHKNYAVFSSRVLKNTFSSHGRFYEGHCMWDNLLERYNTGASLCYYSGHGTGGSGISAQYRNVAEQFPQAELKHEHLKDFTWWDAWRGYMYDDTQTKSPRWGGFTWYNPDEPNLYDIIHFKWVDQLFENLHSIFDLWMSCTTQAHFGPMIYLEHGAALCFGNCGSGLCPQADLLDDWWMHDMLVNGESAGESFSKYVWLHQRDYTTGDPTAMYGSSSLSLTNVQVIYGDPTMTCYSPEWSEPEPIAP